MNRQIYKTQLKKISKHKQTNNIQKTNKRQTKHKMIITNILNKN